VAVLAREGERDRMKYARDSRERHEVGTVEQQEAHLNTGHTLSI